jgi:flagellar hook-basal body complex protein FliE
MSQMQIDQVLAQIRALSSQVAPQPAPGAPVAGGAAAGAPSAFASLLRNSIDQVNDAQQKANELATQFQRGAPGVDLPQVMIEMEKASVSFRALTEVRNRLISAYQDIMNMQM